MRVNVSGVCERDVDLLLLEELQSSPPFQERFATNALGLSLLGRCVSVNRSVTESSGESDLEATFLSEAGDLRRILIENKVNAGFQPRQAERYHHRGRSYISRGDCVAYQTVIVAPARYFGDPDATKGFDGRLTYEQILAWFDQALALGDRRHYKVTLLRSAIEKGTLGYQLIEDAPTSEFWREYWQFARANAAELEMTEPSLKPSGSTFIYFRPPSLPKGVAIVHKLSHGFVDLQLAGMGERLNEVQMLFGSRLDGDMQLKRAAKSAAIRLQVPISNANVRFADQVSDVRIGLDAARRLFVWFVTHQDVWLRRVG